MIINYMLKTFKLIITIVNIAFFIGMFWLIYCEVTMNLVKDWHASDLSNEILEKRWDQISPTDYTTYCATYANLNATQLQKERKKLKDEDE